MDFSQPQRFLDPSTGFSFSNGGNSANQNSTFIVSTGLRLAFEDQSRSGRLLSQELAAQIEQQDYETNRFIAAQGEQLRRALAEALQRHDRALLSAVQAAAARRLREKEAELQVESKRAAELEERVARLRAEALALQEWAAAEQATAAALEAHLRRVSAACNGEEECGETAAEDAESAYVNPERAERWRVCRACGDRAATVVVFPCRHLCMCSACDADGGGGAKACPVCRCVRTASVQVFLS